MQVQDFCKQAITENLKTTNTVLKTGKIVYGDTWQLFTHTHTHTMHKCKAANRNKKMNIEWCSKGQRERCLDRDKQTDRD